MKQRPEVQAVLEFGVIRLIPVFEEAAVMMGYISQPYLLLQPFTLTL
jgi:hypothetical protein